MNILKVIFEKLMKMLKIADFANFEPIWSLNANFAGHPVCGKMLGIYCSFICRSMRGGWSARTGPTQDFTNSPHYMHIPRYTFSC